MKLGALLGLGTRLALGHDRGTKVRSLLMATGVAVGVALLVGAMGAWAGLKVREQRALARGCPCGVSDRIPSDATLWAPSHDTFFDRDLTINVVAPVGEAPVPPGIDRIPAPGQAIVSPALRDILEGPTGRLLRVRIPGRVAGTITPKGLVEPGELTAYVGATRGELGGRAVPVKRWGIPRSEDVGELDLAAIQTIVFGTAALLVPILVFIWTATRLSATRREERLAAIRLVGATPGQVRLLAAIETGLASATGAIGGVLLFLIGRQSAPYLLPAGARLFPQDIAPPPGPAILAVASVPVLSVLVGWLALRKVTRNPMRVVRKARRGALIAVPAAISLGVGLALWVGVFWASGWIGDSDRLQVAYVLSAWILTAIGVLGVSPWVGSRAASGVARLLRGVGPWLGARRLAHDPGAAGHVSAGVVVVVFAASVTLGYLMILGEVQGGGTRETLREEAASVEVYRAGSAPSAFKAISSIEGVGTTVPLRMVVGRGYGRHDVVILPCSRLGSVLETTPTGCTAGAVMITDQWVLGGPADGGGGLPPGTDVRLRTRAGERVGTIHVPLEPEVVDIPVLQHLQAVVVDEGAVSRRTLEASPISNLLVQTDGRPETVERIREELARLLPPASWSVSTSAMLAESASGSGGAVAAAVRIGTIIALAVAAASMLTSTIAAIQDRRRPLAALAAAGVPRRALLWSTAVQTMAPLLAGTVLAAGAAMIVVASTARTTEEVSTVPAITPTLPFVGFALVAGIVATLLAFPSVARSISPDALHHE
jgi:hypothetical protein